jgi:dihydrofolate synthase / folylpolyglutamate synthase
MPSLEYSRIVSELESRTVMPNRPPSLHTTQEALKRVLKSDSYRPERTVVIAGTNGKGSICATLEALLRSAHQHVGLYTSPHLIDTRERIRIQGENVSEDLFCRAYHEVLLKTEGLELSHFEMLTVMAAWIFFSAEASQHLDWFIFEVGLGGLWDSTNAIPHQFCGIASLGFDHQNLLGHTLTDIARNKFGIIHSHAQVVHSPLPEEVKPLARETQAQTQSHWIPSVPYDYHAHSDPHHPRFFLSTKWGRSEIKLPGARGAQNTATALTLFHALGFSPEDHLSALLEVHWPCRMERIHLRSHPTLHLYLSGDHNPQGIESLIELLQAYSYQHLYLLVGFAQDKDSTTMLQLLGRIQKSSLYLTQTPVRSALLDPLAPRPQHVRGVYPDSIQGLQHLITLAQPQDLILVTGSLYLTGHLKNYLQTVHSHGT